MSEEATHTAITTEIKGEGGSEINEAESERAAKRPKHEVIILNSEDEESSESSESSASIDAARPPCISSSAAKRLLAHDKARYERARGIFANQEIDQRSREGLKLEARVQGRERSHYHRGSRRTIFWLLLLLYYFTFFYVSDSTCGDHHHVQPRTLSAWYVRVRWCVCVCVITHSLAGSR